MAMIWERKIYEHGDPKAPSGAPLEEGMGSFCFLVRQLLE
jgi:hypothetical protein